MPGRLAGVLEGGVRERNKKYFNVNAMRFEESRPMRTRRQLMCPWDQGLNISDIRMKMRLMSKSHNTQFVGRK